jgi:thermitase
MIRANWHKLLLAAAAILTLFVVISVVLVSDRALEEPLPTLAPTWDAAQAGEAAVALNTTALPTPVPPEPTAVPTNTPTVAPTEPPTATATPTAEDTAAVPTQAPSATPLPPTQAPVQQPRVTVLQVSGGMPPAEPVPNVVVLRVEPAQIARLQADVSALGGTVEVVNPALGAVTVQLPDESAAEALSQTEYVQAAEPDYYVSAQLTATDPRISDQWSLSAMNIPLSLPDDLTPIKVAVIDSGICADHPELSGKILGGHDFIEGDDTPQDEMGHGCAVAGIIAANWDGQGMAGVAPNARLLIYRVLNAQGSGRYSNVASAIVRAVDDGAQIINLSLGGVNPSQLLQDAVDYAISRGVLVIAAAGNSGSSSVLYPAAYPNVVSVGALAMDGTRALFSNTGKVELWAPGVNVLSLTLANGHTTMSGTSFAAPNVAGLAALEMAQGRSLALGGNAGYQAGEGAVVVVSPTAVSTQTDDNTSRPANLIMRNPATLYCEMMGLQTQKITTEEGETIQCLMPDGSVCNEWDFYAGICGQEYNYCASEDLQTVTLTDGNDAFSPVYSACADVNGMIVGSVSELSALGAQATRCIGPNCHQQLPLYPQNYEQPELGDVSDLSVPASFSWQPYMTSVRDQGKCGSCAVFSAMGAIEGGYKIFGEGSPSKDASEQFFVSQCYTPPHSSGINNNDAWNGICARGSWPMWFYEYGRFSPICGESCMPYLASNFNEKSPVVYPCNHCGNLHQDAVRTHGYITGPYPSNRTALKQYIMTYGPGSMYLRMDEKSGYWNNGVYECSVNHGINHAVVVVGWNDARGTWILRNSWGSSWRNGGYFELRYGHCGSDTVETHFPLVNPLASTNTNIIANGDFSQGFNRWGRYQQMDYAIYNNILHFKRPAGVADSAIVQDIPWRVTNGSGLELSFDVGNTSSVAKDFIVSLRSKATWNNAIQCAFTVPPYTPLRRYVMTGSSREWVGMVVEFRVNADGIPDAMLDNVSLMYKTALNHTAVNCRWQPAGWQPAPANVNLVANSTFDTADGWYAWGGLNYTITGGYAQYNSKPTTAGGALMYDIPYSLAPDSPVEMTVKIHNMGTETRTVALSILRQADWSGSVQCHFNVPPSSGYLTYTMRGRVGQLMNGLRTQIDAADAATTLNFRIDDVVVQYRPSLSVSGTQCIQPNLAPPTTAPVVSAPAITSSSRPTVAWNSVPNADRYTVEFLMNNVIVHANTVTGTSYTPPGALRDGTYSVRVRALNALGQAGPNSAPRSVTIDTVPPANPQKVSPAPGAEVRTFTPTFCWQRVPDAAVYEVSWQPYQSARTTSTCYTMPRQLVEGQQWWNVIACDQAGNCGSWVNAFPYTIVSPTNSAPRVVRQGTNPRLTWNPQDWALGYEVQIATNSSFTALYGSYTLPADILSMTINDMPVGTYYWRIRIKSGATTWSPWSQPEMIVVR